MAYITDENGNYKRTVRCGHCYEKGHNKSACPERKKNLAENVERYTKELAENKFESDWQRQNAQRYLDRSKQQLHKMATRGQNRKCGFCSSPGHTRRTCTDRKEQTKTRLTETLDIRKKTAQRMIDAGFGPGSLVSVGGERLAVITEVRFNDIRKSHVPSKDDYFQGAHGIKFQYLVPKPDNWGGAPQTAGHCYFPVEYLNIDDIPQDEWYRNPSNDSCELVSGVVVSEDSLLTEDTIGEKQMEKWVIENLVDPK
tara:strand:- start:3598 stop:4362 length:765 start_codon:yes stop_codon:yes gene_type:complete